MELYQLKTFVMVAAEENLTRASERLYTSQPAVSAHIKALEEELGVALFIRSKKGMQLTKEGQLLLPKALEILDSAGDLLNQARRLQGKPIGNTRIAVSSNSPHLGIMDFLGVMMNGKRRQNNHLAQKKDLCGVFICVSRKTEDRSLDSGHGQQLAQGLESRSS